MRTRQSPSSETLDHAALLAVGFLDPAERADIVDIARRRLLDIRVAQCGGDEVLIPLHRLLDRVERARAADMDFRRALREDDDILERQERIPRRERLEMYSSPVHPLPAATSPVDARHLASGAHDAARPHPSSQRSVLRRSPPLPSSLYAVTHLRSPPSPA